MLPGFDFQGARGKVAAGLKRATSAVFYGHKQEQGPATHLVAEYIERRRLVEMGFTSSLSSVCAERVDALLVIDGKWRELEAKKAAAQRKGKR